MPSWKNELLQTVFEYHVYSDSVRFFKMLRYAVGTHY